MYIYLIQKLQLNQKKNLEMREPNIKILKILSVLMIVMIYIKFSPNYIISKFYNNKY